MIGKLQRIPLRHVWRHEERDFSSWLSENIEVLGDAIGVRLNTPEREGSAGDFSVDLVGTDEDGETYIIENQLDRSDHDHLGKLITYSAAYGARIAIWIVGDSRPEHTAAVAWLNQSDTTAYYLLKAEAIKIGDSQPALNLTRLVGPSNEVRTVGDEKRAIQTRHQERKAFWTSLLTKANTELPVHRNRSPSDDTWLDATAGARGMSYIYWINQNAWRVTLHLYDESPSWNKAAFQYLESKRVQVDSDFGQGLEWDSRPGERMSELVYRSNRGGYRSPEPERLKVQAEMVDAMKRLYHATKGHLKAAADHANELERSGKLE